MKLNMACNAQAGHKEVTRRPLGSRPTVVSAKRFEGMLCRARGDAEHEILAAVEEEQRYKQYLKDGNDALCKCFTNFESHEANDDEEVQAARDAALAKETQNLRAQDLLDQLRKERIMRANHILHQLKPGTRVLRQGLLESDLIHQRKMNEALHQDIARDVRNNKRLLDEQCPEVLIPFGSRTEEQEKAQRQEQAKAVRAIFLQDLEERRQRKLAEKKQELDDALVARQKCELEREVEETAAKARAIKNREFSRAAYQDALREKAEKAEFEKICEQIDDRIRCVNQVAERNLSLRYNNQIQDMRATENSIKEERAVEVCRLHQQARQRREKAQTELEEEGDAIQEGLELARKAHREKLANQRRAYEQLQRKKAGGKRLREHEVRRFEIATRYKNAEANKAFVEAEEQQEKETKAKLKKVLFGQRQEFLKQRQNELMRVTACEEDPHLEDDVDFFRDTVALMEESRELGRPLYPIARAAERYQRDNQVDMTPEGNLVCRNTTRDACWPGFYSKAEMAFRKYLHREKCRRENEAKRHSMFDNCLKITKMAAEEKPFQPCVQSGIDKCFQHRGLPELDCTLPETGKNADAPPEQPEEATPLEAKEAAGDEVVADDREIGGGDYKRDGMSRSLLAKASTKQRKSTKPIETPPPAAKCEVRSNSSTLHQKATKLPESSHLLASKSQSIQSIRLPNSLKVTSATEVRSLNSKLHDPRRYSTSKVEAMRRQPDRRTTVEASSSSAVLEKSAKLPDLTKYWTPKLHTLQRKADTVDKSVVYTKSPHNLKA